VGGASVISGRSAGVTTGTANSQTTAARGTGVATTPNVATAPQTTAGNLNTIGAGSIMQPAANSAIGNASIVGNAAGTANTSIPIASLPAGVQTALQSFSGNGGVQQITQVPGVNGASTYQATVLQNGVPTQLQISSTGQILAQTPITTANALTAGMTAAATLPVSALPAAVQNGLATQIGPNGAVESVSRANLANGPVYTVTANQNGVPTQLQFAANGTLIGSSVLSGGGTLFTGTPVVLDELPGTIQSAIRGQLGNGAINRITQMQGTNGMSYLVGYDQNGTPMTMVVGPDGKIRSNGPSSARIAAVRGPAAARAAEARTNMMASTATNGAPRSVSMKLEDLPGPVSRTLKDQAKYSEVRYITREPRVGGDIYVIGLRNEDRAGELTLSADGTVLNDSRRSLADLSIVKSALLDNDTPEGIPLAEVPVAIQDAIKAYATASEIRSIGLGLDRDGKTVYEIVYYNGGERDRMVVDKEGSVRRIEQNVSPAAELPNGNKAPVIAIGDLPPAVRETIQRQTANVRVEQINTKEVGDQMVYRVSYHTNGTPVELLVARDGAIVRAEGSPSSSRSDTPLPAPITKDAQSNVRVVDASAPNRPLPPSEPTPASEASGKSASAEHGTAGETNLTNSSNSTAARLPASTSLKDVPASVRDAAKDIAGNEPIQNISPRLQDSAMVYDVTYGRADQKTVTLNKDGKIQKKSSDSNNSSK
jgi:hypothetical protein